MGGAISGAFGRSNKSSVSDSRTPFSTNWITCTIEGIITDCSKDASEVTGYDTEYLVGQFIGILMSPFMSYLHSTVLLRRYKDASQFERNMMHLFLKGKSYRRPLIIYTSERQPLYVEISVTTQRNHNTDTSASNTSASNTSASTSSADDLITFCLSFVVRNDLRDSSIYLMSALEPKMFPHFRETKNNLIIANIGYTRGRTDDESDRSKVSIHIEFQEALVRIIKTNFYPYVYIYETSNHGCVLVSNLCCSYNIPGYCASLMVCCLYNLCLATITKLRLNIGVAYGRCQIGALANGEIRIFGNTYDDAHHCRQLSDQANIGCTTDFSYKLTMERVYINSKEPLFGRSFEHLVPVDCFDGCGPNHPNHPINGDPPTKDVKGKTRKISCNRINLAKIDNHVLHESDPGHRSRATSDHRNPHPSPTGSSDSSPEQKDQRIAFVQEEYIGDSGSTTEKTNEKRGALPG